MAESPSIKVRLPAAMVAQVDAFAVRYGLDRSEAVRGLLLIALSCGEGGASHSPRGASNPVAIADSPRSPPSGARNR